MITLYPINEYKSGFILKGHAEYAESGKDIVCSAVSSLAQSVFLTINKEYKITHIQSHGFLEVNYEEILGILLYVRVLLTGMEEIAKQYPSYVSISEEEYKDEEN